MLARPTLGHAPRRALLVLLCASALGSCTGGPDRAPERVAAVLAARLATPEPPAERDSLEREVRGFYARRHHRPAWSDGRRPGASAFACAEGLARAAREGLDPRDYGGAALGATCERLRRVWPAAAPESLAALELALTRGFLRYARDARDGRLPLTALDPDWLRHREPLAARKRLGEALREGHTALVMDALGPRDPGSRALREALGRLLDTAARGGWPRLLPGEPPRRGDRGPAVARLRLRLAHETALDTSDTAARYDDAVAEAVREFQRRHGLPATGAVDARTRAALDVPAERRARTVALNLERRRWMPLPPREPYLQVNLPDFSLELHDSARVVLRMRVVIGEPRNPTPVFSDAVTYLEFNPTWRVPRRIVAEEIAPAQRRDTSYLARNQMRVFRAGPRGPLEVAHTEVDWRAAESDSFPWLVVEDGGPKNPLGRMKFMCPNEYDVYLHDTPLRSHFTAEARARSHGCVRLQRPRELAERLLASRFAQAVADSVDSLVAGGATRRVLLERGLPVHVMYWTAWVDSAGALQSRDDVYGLDARLADALQSGRVGDFVLNPPVEWDTETTRAAAAERKRAAAVTERASGAALRRP